MFRAINPDALVEVAAHLELRADRLHRTAVFASQVLHHRTGLAAQLIAIERWAGEAAADLRWRANTIRMGQERGRHLPSLVRAEFAATGVFAPGTQDAALDEWLRAQAARRARINDAVARIGEWLEQGWLDWDVTNGDLHNIVDTLASLAGSELDEAIASLSDHQLERWIAEMGNSFNGFSRDEKQAVFELLATNASGASLHRIHDALLTSGGQQELIDLGQAIQLQSADRTIVDFVTATIGGDLIGQRFSTLAPGLAVQALEDRTAATRAAEPILRHPHALPWFAIDAAEAGQSPNGTIAALARSTNGGDLTAGLVTALALLAAPADLREAATARHRKLAGEGNDEPRPRCDEARDHLLAAATALLAANPEAVFTHLATTADPEGDLTAALWHGLASRGDAESIARVLAELRGGAEVDLVRFAARGTVPDYEYPYARNLAFAAATLNRGFTESAEDAHGDIDAIVKIAGVATSVAGLLTGGSAVAEALVGTGAGWTVEGHAGAVGDGIDAQLAHLIDRATSQLRPADQVDLSAYPDTGNAMLAWTSVYTRLLPFA